MIFMCLSSGGCGFQTFVNVVGKQLPPLYQHLNSKLTRVQCCTERQRFYCEHSRYFKLVQQQKFYDKGIMVRNIGIYSNLSQSRSRCPEEDNNSNNEDWNVGRKRHHPTDHFGPCWVRTTTILHWLVAHKAEYQDQLKSHQTQSRVYNSVAYRYITFNINVCPMGFGSVACF